MNHIRARQTGLVVTEAGHDLMVYNEASQELHTLNPLAALVWNLADGQTSAPEMLTSVKVLDPQATPATVEIAIASLSKAGLLETHPRPAQSRRTLLKRAAVGGAVLPTVVSITVPMAAHAASPAVCDPTHFETLAACNAAIPAYEQDLEDRGCSITTPLQCQVFEVTGCYWISGSWTGCVN